MKKFHLAVISFIGAAFMALSAALLADVKSVSAQAETHTMPTLSTTKVLVSKNNDKMLLATAIKDKEDVYEVGYIFTNEVETVVAVTP